MISKSVAFLLADLGVTKTHSRPHVSNDNPVSEAQFKTLKYRPGVPGPVRLDPRRASPRAHGHVFFPWYNTAHHHSGLGLLTPHDVHFGLAEQRVAERAAVLTLAYAAHPERFPAGCPRPAAAPTEVWVNPPPAPRARGGGAHSLNSRPDCLVLIDRLRIAHHYVAGS
jgi:putative transposase